MNIQKAIQSMHVSDMNTQAEDYIKETLSAQATRIKKLENIINGYLEKFDDIAISDIVLKKWLDKTWIPEARAALKEAE